jgi:hypothetical protein
VAAFLVFVGVAVGLYLLTGSATATIAVGVIGTAAGLTALLLPMPFKQAGEKSTLGRITTIGPIAQGREKESLRAQNQVRLVRGLETATPLAQLPGGVFGFATPWA